MQFASYSSSGAKIVSPRTVKIMYRPQARARANPSELIPAHEARGALIHGAAH